MECSWQFQHRAKWYMWRILRMTNANSGLVGWSEKVGCGWLLWPWCNYRHGIQPVGCQLRAYGLWDLRGIKAATVSWEGNQKKKKTCLYSWTLSSRVPNLSPIFFCIFCWPSQLNFSQHHHVSPAISAENACRFEDVRPSCCIHRRGGTLCGDNFLNQQGFKAGSARKKNDILLVQFQLLSMGSMMKQGFWCVFCHTTIRVLWMLLENDLECTLKHFKDLEGQIGEVLEKSLCFLTAVREETDHSGSSGVQDDVYLSTSQITSKKNKSRTHLDPARNQRLMFGPRA